MSRRDPTERIVYKNWWIDLSKNLLCGPAGYEQRIGPRQAEILHLLISKKGEVADLEWMIGRLWGYDSSENSRNTIHVHIHKVRQILPSVLEIKVAYRKGYWLYVGEWNGQHASVAH